jgi:hypothetical protein
MRPRPEVAGLSDEQLLSRVEQSRAEAERAKLAADQAVVDAMVAGLNQTLIAERAGVSRRALFGISDRVWSRRQADSVEQPPTSADPR